jgi:hypothetical protein
MHLADEVRRNLSGTETGHAHGRRNPLDLAFDASVDVLGRNGELVGPLEAFVFRLNGLHGHGAFPIKK